MAAKIKKGDRVVVLTGKRQGPSGRRCYKVMPKESRVLVGRPEHRSSATPSPAKADPKGGIKNKEASLHISNVAFIDPKSGAPHARRFQDRRRQEGAFRPQKSGEVING